MAEKEAPGGNLIKRTTNGTLARYDKNHIGSGGLVFLKKARLNCSAPLPCVCPDAERVPLPWLQTPISSFLLKSDAKFVFLHRTIFFKKIPRIRSGYEVF
jgi:hypothetical protein